MDERPNETPAPAEAPSPSAPAVSAPTERGWGKLLLALAAFLLIPVIWRAIIPIDQATTLLIPAIAACALVGWWAGGRAFTAILWVIIAGLLTMRADASPTPFDNLARGWSLLLAGSFGLVCLFGPTRPLFGRALAALGMTLGLATIMCLVGPVSISQASAIVADEFARRNAEIMAATQRAIQMNSSEWAKMTEKMPALVSATANAERGLSALSEAGVAVFPA
jgi:hypothetical protein